MTYEEYHARSLEAGDIDPSYEMLRYVCDRFELTTEQRYWLAFLYATCYSGPTVFYIYNEFPDYENVDVDRLWRWWNENKGRCVFQTDRRWVKSKNSFVPMFESYRDWCAGVTQGQKWQSLNSGDPFLTYDIAFEDCGKIEQMGRFSLFLFLEAVHVVTGFPMKPRSMDIREADSCRNGLAEAIGRPKLNTHLSGARLPTPALEYLQGCFDMMVSKLTAADPRNTVCNIETTLCAYKKYKLGKRYIGYYLDRQAGEIEAMQKNVREGVDWSVLWDYRRETYQKQFLKELR